MENLLNLEKLSEANPVATVITTRGSYPTFLCLITLEGKCSASSFSWK